MKKGTYFLGLLGSVILLIGLISALYLNFSYTFTLYNFVFSMEILAILIYITLLSINFFSKEKKHEDFYYLLNAFSIIAILILPFNLFWANISFNNISMSLYNFFLDLFRSLPNYIIIIPLILCFYLMRKNHSFN